MDSVHAVGPKRSDERRWLKRFGRSGPAEVRLLCFHHAGGTASMYRTWARSLPWFIEPVAVQLPGRADRFAEPPFDRLPPLLDALVEVLEPLLDTPYCLYGTSMGARVAWSLAHTLRERSLPGPRLLYVASSAAPGCDDGEWGWDAHSDHLTGYLRQLGGTPEEVLAEPELLAGLLPTLRADLTVLSAGGFRPRRPLDVPIHAFAGADDVEGSPERMDPWRAETTARFEMDVVPGGHFFDPIGEQQVHQVIARDLDQVKP